MGTIKMHEASAKRLLPYRRAHRRKKGIFDVA
jgi:hypothetical protein